MQVDLSGHGHLNLLPLGPGVPLPQNIARLEMDMAFVEASERVCNVHTLNGTVARNVTFFIMTAVL